MTNDKNIAPAIEIQNVGSDAYRRLMCRGHRDLKAFIAQAIKDYPSWFPNSVGWEKSPSHIWFKTIPSSAGCDYPTTYHEVRSTARGSFTVTYLDEIERPS